MAYLAFYRTFRPARFEDVVRQESIVRILKNQITNDKIGHAYLFCGPRGTGKTTLAKIFSKAINCESPIDGSPCGKCPTCKALSEGSNLDIIEIDGASNNSVEQMRDLKENVQYPPVSGRFKVYIIDEVHMLTPQAFNAVLKTLEEPPRHAVFILATTDPQKIPATILSRCMRFDFKLIPQEDLEGLIRTVLTKSGKDYENEAITAIARAGAGSARDCLSIADMCASYSTGKMTYKDVNAVLGSADIDQISRLCALMLEEDMGGSIAETERILSTGKSVGVLMRDMLNFFNNCTIAKVCRDAEKIINLPKETYLQIEQIAKKADGHRILRTSEILAQAESNMRFSTNPKITVETAIAKCAMPSADYNIDSLISRINELEKKLSDMKINAYTPDYARISEQQKPSVGKTESPFEEVETSRKELKPKVALIEEDETEKVPLSIFDEQPIARTESKKVEVVEKSERGEAVQPTLFENTADKIDLSPISSLTDDEKKKVFGKLMVALRTTRRNAIVFSLCMGLDSSFEMDKLILSTDSESIERGLKRPDNAKFLADVLAELGVYSYEIRRGEKQTDGYEEALKTLKENFDGTDIEIK